MTDVYTIDEVARHSNTKDLWVVIHGVIYNVTEFKKEHPGGEEVLLKLAGQDATEYFENVGHSSEAIELRKRFKIGELVDDAKKSSSKLKTKSTDIKEPEENDWQSQESTAEVSVWSWMFMCTVVALYGIIIYYWFRKLTS